MPRPLSRPPPRSRLGSGLSPAQPAAEFLFSRGREGRVAKAFKASERGLLARRHFQKFAKARRNSEKRSHRDERIVASSQKSAHARPFPIARLGAEPGPHGSEGEIAHRIQHMGFVHRHAAEPALKKMSGDARGR